MARHHGSVPAGEVPVNQQQVEIEGNRIVLVLHEGGLPTGMSTFEAKKFAVDKVFGGLVSEVGRLVGIGSTGEIVLQVREALEIR
jgi:hypothetical protein